MRVLQLCLVLWKIYQVRLVGYLWMLATFALVRAMLIPHLHRGCILGRESTEHMIFSLHLGAGVQPGLFRRHSAVPVSSEWAAESGMVGECMARQTKSGQCNPPAVHDATRILLSIHSGACTTLLKYINVYLPWRASRSPTCNRGELGTILPVSPEHGQASRHGVAGRISMIFCAS